MSLKRNILDLRKRKEIVLQGGGEDAIKKQAAMGKLTARERIEGILDKGSFHEYDIFVEHQSKDFDMESLDHVKEAPVKLWGPMAVITAVMVSVTFWSTPLFNFLETVAKGVF